MAWRVVVALLAVVGVPTFASPLLTFPETLRGSSRIVSGWEAVEAQFPFQLSLRMVSPVGAVSACGATIIHNEWALTAAHCTATRITVVIRLGTVNLTRPAEIFETTDYINHPLYDEEMQQVVQPHDIGLIRFPRAIEYNDRIQPIRMQSSADKDRNYEGAILTASGWGRTWTQGSSPENMNWVFLRGVTNDECLQAFGGSDIIVDSTICAAYYNVSSQSTCQGDSGGALTVVDKDGITSQVGISSFVSRTGCHTPYPAGFIRPGHYHDWYLEVTGIDFDWQPESDESDESNGGGDSNGSGDSKSSEESDESDESNGNGESNGDAESDKVDPVKVVDL